MVPLPTRWANRRWVYRQKNSERGLISHNVSIWLFLKVKSPAESSTLNRQTNRQTICSWFCGGVDFLKPFNRYIVWDEGGPLKVGVLVSPLGDFPGCQVALPLPACSSYRVGCTPYVDITGCARYLNSQEVFIKSLCISQFSHKSVNLSFATLS